MFSSLLTTVQTPAKCPGPRSAPSSTSERPAHLHRRGEALGVDLAHGRGEQHVDAELGGLGGVVGLGARVGGEVAGVVELGRVDEQRDDHGVLLLARRPHQRVVAGVEGAHRRHEPDRPALGARVPEPGAHLGDGADRPHVQLRPTRHGARRPRPARPTRGKQLRRPLGDRGAVALDRALVAAGDRRRSARPPGPSSRPLARRWRARAGRAARA